jgi:hypothetical protein
MRDWESYGNSHDLFQGSVLALTCISEDHEKLIQVRNFTIWVTLHDEYLNLLSACHDD